MGDGEKQGDLPCVRDVMTQRNEEYGPAWLVTSQVLRTISVCSPLNRIRDHDLFFVWVMIINKAIRLVVSPTHRDSWVDIIGYANLALKYIDEKLGNRVDEVIYHTGLDIRKSKEGQREV
jgi:hypothetical protein